MARRPVVASARVDASLITDTRIPMAKNGKDAKKKHEILEATSVADRFVLIANAIALLRRS